MSNPLASLFSASAAENERVLAALAAKFPELAPAIRQTADELRDRPDGPAGPSSMMKYLPWALAALGFGGTMMGSTGNLDLSALTKDLPELHVANRWSVFAILALVGAAVGTVHSIYRNGGLRLPAAARDDARNMLVLTNYGFLGDLFYGLVAAVAVSWSALPSSIGAGDNGNLLKWNLVLSASVAAFGGAKAWSGWRGNVVARQALAEASTLPAGSEELRKAILDAKTIADAAMLASGKRIPGRELPAGATVAPAEIERELFQLLDPKALRELLPSLPRAPGPDGAGLTVGTLHAFGVLAPGLRQGALANIALADVARMSRGDFAAAVAAAGIDAERFRPALDELADRAGQAMRALAKLPPNWTLVADRLPKA